MLLATRLGVGIGEAACTPAATSWIGDLVPASRRARAMAGFMMAVPVGIMLSSAISGPVAQAHGWRMALMLAAIPGLVLAPAVLCLREPERPAPAAADADAATLPAVFWWIAASGAVVNFALYSFSTFLPAFLTRYHGMSVAQAGIWTGIGSGVSGILGAGAAGLLGDRVKNRLWLAAGASLLAAGPVYAAIRMPAGSAAAAVWLAMTGYGLLQMYYGLVYAAIQDVDRARDAGPRDGGLLPGDLFGRGVVGSATDRTAQRFPGAPFRAGGGSVARRRTTRCDVRSSGPGFSSCRSAMVGRTAANCTAMKRRARGPVSLSHRETQRTFPAARPSLLQSFRAY